MTVLIVDIKLTMQRLISTVEILIAILLNPIAVFTKIIHMQNEIKRS